MQIEVYICMIRLESEAAAKSALSLLPLVSTDEAVKEGWVAAEHLCHHVGLGLSDIARAHGLLEFALNGVGEQGLELGIGDLVGRCDIMKALARLQLAGQVGGANAKSLRNLCLGGSEVLLQFLHIGKASVATLTYILEVTTGSIAKLCLNLRSLRLCELAILDHLVNRVFGCATLRTLQLVGGNA